MLTLTQVMAENGGGGSMWGMLFPVVAIVLIMYFLLIGPQRKKERRRQQMLKSLEKNDHVITIGGIHGVVRGLTDRDVTILVDEKQGVTLKMNRSAVYALVDRDEEGELPRRNREEESITDK